MKDLRLAYPLGYTSVALIEVRQTDVYTRWFRRLRDRWARARIDLRIDCGPGYRVYFRGVSALVILLAGGDKSSQQRDIARARSLARGL